MATKHIRWSDNDHHLGPFTFARERIYKTFAIDLRSTDDEDRGYYLRLSALGFTAILALPSWVLRPEREKIVPGWDEATVQRLGRDWYWKVTPREFGIHVHEGYLSISYGRVTHDSSTEQRWGWFFPWCQWRFVRWSLYGTDGKLYGEVPPRARFGTADYDRAEALQESCPTVSFQFSDFDGERLVAKTKIEEREWLFGTGYFKWLSLLRSSKVRRSLDLKFSGETGRRKGSWKGGTIGAGIDMIGTELHESAFRRYCAENEMVFIGITKP